MAINVQIKDGWKSQHASGIHYRGELFSIEESGCWVNIDQCHNVAFGTDELRLPRHTSKSELGALVDDECDPEYAKQLVTALLRARARKDN